jgi:cation transport ATPase
MKQDPADPHHLATRPEDEFQTVKIATAGMQSEEMMRRAEAAVRGLEGVQEARADFPTASMRVTFDPAKTDVPAIHDCIGRSGYEAAPSTTPELAQRGPEML